MKNKTKDTEPFQFAGLKKTIPYNILNLVDYNSESVSTTAILQAISGQVTAMAFDSGVGLEEKTIAFDTFVLVIEGSISVVIDKETFQLKTGEGMTMPAHHPHAIKPGGKFKLIMTILKGGYEQYKATSDCLF